MSLAASGLHHAGWGPVAVAVAGALVCGGAGGGLTRIDDWYRNLRKPSWQPPDWLFGPVWTIIIGLGAWSAVLGWRHAGTERAGLIMAALFVANVALNAGWSYFFFFIKRPDLALREVVGLWLSIVALIVALSGISALGAWLLVPYLVWVSFAAYLNLTIVRLNGAFA
jgi:tryptophan-rich sensory protein